jgi:dihydroflavonol-4-reductase
MESERIVLSKSKEIDVIVVNPTFLIGPYDNKPSSGRIILMSFGKKVVLYPPGGKNFVHVADVAKGIVSTLEIGKNGEKYLLANENLTYREFFQKLSAKSNSRVILIKIPKYLLLAIGIVGSILKYAGIKNELFLTNMSMLCTCNFYSNKKAKTELNIKFRSIDIALQEAIEWFKENKRIK